ncbi:hypothetical protein [Curtobacterium sp. VKM Ac-1395]|uniref:hypothetical protein n=1 Tax=Curtobacterium sp. VKM Ac-1395 TaxID=2783815 RepID=UPI00188B6421|nr:hypothetical protein [Curtobacterium sp. VKM Ac-1395]MBF4591260.1 hypothetical protein [Curtobacterium sp. VKM Ac-1395]
MSTQDFFVDNLDVVRFRASQGDQTEEHIKWRVGYAPASEEGVNGQHIRVVIATLHVGGNGGWAEIDAGAFLVSDDEGPDDDNLEAAVRQSIAVEAVYDFARSHLRGLLATIGVFVDIPVASPDPDMFVLVPHDDVEEPDDEEDPRATQESE